MTAIDVVVLTVIAAEFDAAQQALACSQRTKTQQGTVVHTASLPSARL